MHSRASVFGNPRLIRAVVLATLGITTISCSTFGKREGGALIGAAGGAAVGGAIGKNNGSTARGAIIGAVIGGTAGAVIGHQMDQQAKEIRLNIPGATVERVGEGIAVTFGSGLMFDYDKDDIRSDAAINLQNLATSLKKYPDTQLLVVGHTDALGSGEYNQDLSLRRANAAMQYLGRYGVGASRIGATGRGEREPVGSNESEAGRQMNRRIEVAIYASAAARAGH